MTDQPVAPLTWVAIDIAKRTHVVLVDFDPEYRARANRRQRELDDSLGGSLRRLREAKGVSRSDFPSVSPKTIARIERGEVQARPKTLQKIARRLGVEVEEISTY
ncbi:MAG: XRE family transcriptional regulator [Gemmatimonadales bacterium]|nr:MAG: XRE family transcriptional regulator [Gemmatimonadales bacterium]